LSFFSTAGAGPSRYSWKGGRLARRARARPQRPELANVNNVLWPREVAFGLAEATTAARRSREADPVSLQLRQEVGVDNEEVSVEELLDDTLRGRGIRRHYLALL